MSQWNTELYMRFASERTRPAAELLARIPLLPSQVHRIVDLGCGPGNSTQLLQERFSSAHILGVDQSASMLASATANVPQAEFVQAEIEQWISTASHESIDVIFANAALHWVSNHENLIPKLFSLLAPGGVLAIQVPDNCMEPSHVIMREVAGLDRFSGLTAPTAFSRAALLSPRHYYQLLAAASAQTIDIWHSVYQHPMPSSEAIVDWLRSTGLRTYLDALPQHLQSDYLSEYEKRIDQAYPAMLNSMRLFTFPRLFIVARRTVSL